MSDKKKINKLKKLIEEQLWYIQRIAEDKKIFLEIGRMPMETSKDRLNARFWAMIDILQMIKELEE